MKTSSGENTSATGKPGERGEGDDGHAESKLEGLATSGRQGTIASDTFESCLD